MTCPTFPTNLNCKDDFDNLDDLVKTISNNDQTCTEFNKQLNDHLITEIQQINNLNEEYESYKTNIEGNTAKIRDFNTNMEENEHIRTYRLETSNHNVVKLRLKYIIFIVLIFVILLLQFGLLFL